MGGCHSSMVLSVPTILRPRVQILSTRFFLLKLYRENNKNKQKRGRDWPIFLKKNSKAMFEITLPIALTTAYIYRK